jgi:thioredoxin reductase (NADPH)
LNPRLNDDQLALLQHAGSVRSIATDDVLFGEGDVPPGLIVVLEGRVAVVDHPGGIERELAERGPRSFVGELSLMTGQRAWVSAIAREPGSVIIVPVGRFKELVTQDQALGDLLLQTMFRRREMIDGLHTGVRIVGSRFSPDTHRLGEFAARNRLAHVWYDVDDDADAASFVQHLGMAPQDLPIVILSEGNVLRNPTNATLAAAFGLRGGRRTQRTSSTNPRLEDTITSTRRSVAMTT